MEKKTKNKNYSNFSLRLNDLKDWKNITLINMERLKQTISEIGELNKTTKPKMKEFTKSLETFRKKENPFDFTDYLERQ